MAFHSDAGSRPGTVQRGLRGAGCAVDETTMVGSSDGTVDATGWSTAGGGARAGGSSTIAGSDIGGCGGAGRA